MGDVDGRTVVRIKISYSNGETEEFDVEALKNASIKDFLLAAINDAVAYLKKNGYDRWKPGCH